MPINGDREMEVGDLGSAALRNQWIGRDGTSRNCGGSVRTTKY